MNLNYGSLAHGYRLIDEATYARFAEVVDALLDRLLVMYARDRRTWETEHTFVQPFGAALA